MFNKLKTKISSWFESCSDNLDSHFFDLDEFIVPSQFQWQLLTKDATVPLKATDGSAGYDLNSNEDTVVSKQSRQWISTGVSIAFPAGWVGLVWPRSGLAGKGIDTSAGVIDSDYRGELKVLLVNSSNEDFVIEKGNRIAQLILVQSGYYIEFSVVDCLYSSERGKNGFGSTGV